MRPCSIKPVARLTGVVNLPGDKSIAHRSIILSAICRGKTVISNLPFNEDCLSTISIFKQLGVKITRQKNNKAIILGNGLFSLSKPKRPVFIGDSGTTFRLLLGVLAGQKFKVKLTAGKSLSRRPMLRITKPLRMMGAVIKSQATPRLLEEYPPITIQGNNLQPIHYKMPVASAQVKSAILLAGLYASGKTEITEPIQTRDHTERMLKLFAAKIKTQKNKIILQGKKELRSPGKIYIPGDISSASFFVVAAIIVPQSKIVLKRISLNPSRIGIIKVLQRMGADIEVSAVKNIGIEPIGDLIINSSKLEGTVVKKEEIPSLIDELPILLVAACFAKGKTEFQAVQELRVKETDRIKSMCVNLKKMGACIKVIKSGGSEKIIVHGIRELKGAKVSSFGDHRTAMSLIIAGLKARGITHIDDIICIKKSFPGFTNLLNTVIHKN